MDSDAAPQTGLKSKKCVFSSLIVVIRIQILTVLGDDTAHNTTGTYDEEGADSNKDEAAPQTGLKSKKCGFSSLIVVIGIQILTVPGDETAHNTTGTYNEEGSEGSEDEFCPPPPCEDVEDSVNDGESEEDGSEKEATKKLGPKKGKMPKPGQRDVVAVRETYTQKPTY